MISGQERQMQRIPMISLSLHCLMAVVLLSCQAIAGERERPAPSKSVFAKRVGGMDIIRLIREADTVEAVRVHPRKGVNDRADVAISGKPFHLDPELASMAKDLFTNPSTYLDGTSMCIFEPGVKITFQKGPSSA